MEGTQCGWCFLCLLLVTQEGWGLTHTGNVCLGKDTRIKESHSLMSQLWGPRVLIPRRTAESRCQAARLTALTTHFFPAWMAACIHCTCLAAFFQMHPFLFLFLCSFCPSPSPSVLLGLSYHMFCRETQSCLWAPRVCSSSMKGCV